MVVMVLVSRSYNTEGCKGSPAGYGGTQKPHHKLRQIQIHVREIPGTSWDMLK